MERIQEEFQVFDREGGDPVGAVRQVMANQLVIYVENAGDFEVPLAMVTAVHDGKVVLDAARLDPRLSDAIRRARQAEDPRIS
ncbi:MAG: hypothetical protein JO256_15510 [Alphaproteobacteria bacterium]|nr:hypothetical protein [Alphaproteobacteria bacterium]